jgi:hypothetical protein
LRQRSFGKGVVMAEPKSFVAYAPFGVGVMCALFYFERKKEIYGWWIGARDLEFHSAYFKLEDYFTTRPTRFYATEGMDLYGGWRYLYSARRAALDKPVPIEDTVVHELDRLQGAFAAEWLVFEDDRNIEAEREAYGRMGLILGHAAIRSKRIGAFDVSQPVWIHRSHGCDMNVVEYLRKHWPLDSIPSFAEPAL